MIIAIDGPAGSGKSTIAREVAKRLGLRYVDTGAMYRTATLLALEAGLVPDRVDEVAALAARAGFRIEERPDDLYRVFVGEREVTEQIRGPVVSENVSLVSAEPGVRAVLTQKQQEEVALGDVVLEGRDMGTVVAPCAEVKIFLNATIEERARRRQLQLQEQGVSQSLDQLIADINARDAYDSAREVAPLRKAHDAVEIDTTGMTIEEVVSSVCRLASERQAGGPDMTSTPEVPDEISPRTVLSPAVAGSRAARWPLSRMVCSPLDTPLYRFAYWLIPPLWRLIFRVRVTGSENIPATGAVVLASNHRSNLDPFFLGSCCPRMVHFMAKAELWRFKPLGRLVEKLGAFPVNRGEVDRNAVKKALEVLSAGAVLGLFPEGRRQREESLGEIRPGVTLFSLRQGVATVPVVMKGTDRVVRGGIPRFPRVHMIFGSPIAMPADDLPRSQRSLVATQRLVEAYQRLLTDPSEAQ